MVGMPYAPRQRSRGPAAASDDVALRAAALGILADPPQHLSGRDAAIAHALSGATDVACRLLEEVTRREPNNAHHWSDYAALLLQRGLETQDFAMIARSLAASDRALALAPSTAEALFNRAAALEALHLDAPAAETMKRYLSVDAQSPWAGELRTRMQPLAPGERQSAPFPELLQTLETSAVSTQIAGALVAASPRDARRHGESVLLTRWAEATLQGDMAGAQRSLAWAAAIGDALERRSGERFLRDASLATNRTPAGERIRLAHALLRYRDGRKAYAEWRIEDALRSLQHATGELSALAHPMAAVARYYAATALADAGRYDAASRELGELRSSAPQSSIALHAQIRWTEGTILVRTRRLNDGAEAYRDSARRFEMLGELFDALRMKHLLAHILTLLGQPAEAWRVRAGAFEQIDERLHRNLLVFAVFETAQQAMFEQDWDVAHSFYDLTLGAPDKSSELESRALVERALSSWRGGFAGRARRELAEAEAFPSSIEDPTIREGAIHALGYARAVIAGDDDPARAIRALRAAIDFHRGRNDGYALPWMLAEEARLLRKTGDAGGAIADLEDAIAIVRTSAAGVSDSLLRDQYLGTIDSLYRALIDAYLSTGRTEDAFAVMERQRSEALIEHDGGRGREPQLQSIDAIARLLPRDGAMLHYTTVGEDVWLIAIPAAGTFSLHKLDVDTSQLVARIDAFHEAIAAGRDDDAYLNARALHTVLLAPVATAVRQRPRLVFVPDRALAGVPFAALRDDRAFLVETSEVVVAPSANVYAELTRRRTSDRLASVAIVADPAFDPAKHPNLTRLHAAAREGRSIAGLYPAARNAHGSDASVERVSEMLDDAQVLHIAAHAVVDTRDPGRSAFLLAPDELYLHALTAADLHRVQLVVLAGCRTGTHASSTGNLSSLSSAFLAAGAASVVGTLWDVGDVVTQQFAVRFHQRIAAGTAPATALRETQIEMLRSADPQARRLASWAGLQMYGPLS